MSARAFVAVLRLPQGWEAGRRHGHCQEESRREGGGEEHGLSAGHRVTWTFQAPHISHRLLPGATPSWAARRLAGRPWPSNPAGLEEGPAALASLLGAGEQSLTL